MYSSLVIIASQFQNFDFKITLNFYYTNLQKKRKKINIFAEKRWAHFASAKPGYPGVPPPDGGRFAPLLSLARRSAV
jgi:hypothetical protein